MDIKTMFALALSVVLVGCGSVEFDPSTEYKQPQKPQTPAQVGSASYGGHKKDFHFVLSPAGVGEWNLEPLLTRLKITVSDDKVSGMADNVPPLRKGGSEMVDNHAQVQGTYDGWTGKLTATYTFANTEKSTTLTYVQAGHGTLTGQMAADGKTMSVEVDGTKSSVTMENVKEGGRQDSSTKYSFVAEVGE